MWGCGGVTPPLFAYLVGISWIVGKTDRLIHIYIFIIRISVVVAVNVRSVRSCCPAVSIFPVWEIVKYMIYLPPRIEQCMFVGKSMKLHPHSKWSRDAPGYTYIKVFTKLATDI